MLKSLRAKSVLPILAVALAAPALAGQTPAPQESPWAMRAPSPAPHAAQTPASAAEEVALKPTPAQQELARKVTAAMKAKDYDAMELLVAPSTIKCIGKNKNFLQDRFHKQFSLPISTIYNLTVYKLPPGSMGANQYATWPMPPTYYMGIEFASGDDTATVNLVIGQENGHWYEAQPCPTDAGMKRFAQIQERRARGRKQAEAAVTQVKDPLKSQLLALVGKHDSVSAWKLCMSTQHWDFPTCRGVVAILAGDTNY
jgi:hypothetical protein